MARARRGHQPKSLEEKRAYWNTIIRAPAGPTVEDKTPIIDTTDSSKEAEEAPTGRVTPTKPPSVFVTWLRERLVEIIAFSVFLPVLGWSGCQLYTLNREIGEIRSDLINEKSARTQLSSQIDNVENRLTGQIESLSSEVVRLDGRIDNLMDSRNRQE